MEKLYNAGTDEYLEIPKYEFVGNRKKELLRHGFARTTEVMKVEPKKVKEVISKDKPLPVKPKEQKND